MQTQSLAPNVQKESLELSLEKALMVKDVLLLSPGNWNGDEYTEEIIRNVFENTDWSESRHSHLYLDHKDTQEKSGVGAWAGFVRNPRLNELGELRGDLEIWHPMAAIWTKAHPKFGISATITAPDGETPTSFESFSIVHDPACRPAIINLSKDPLKDVEELKKITGFEAVRKRMGLSPTQFYAAPRDPPSASSLPIFDAAHVRNAMARFNQVRFKSSGERATAKNKIIRAANKFGIKVERFKKLSDSIDSPLESEELNKEKEIMPEEQKAEEEQKPEEKSEEKSEEELSNKVKALSEKIDKLTSIVEKKILAEESEDKEEPEDKEEEEEPKKEEESEVKEELSSLKKELSAFKKEMKEKDNNKPEVKTLAAQAKELSREDTNMGMLKFLQARVM